MSNLSLKSDQALLQIALDQEQEMLEKVEAVGKGWNSGLIISGPPGTGKSHTVKALLSSMKGLSHVSDVQTIQDNDKSSPTYKQWHEVSRSTGNGPLVRKTRYAPWSLVRDCWRNPNKNNIIVIDDNDLALQDLNFCSIIMNATEQEADREIHYTAKKIQDLEREGVIDCFNYSGGIIMLTNYNMRDCPKEGDPGFKKYHERWRAMVSRLAGSYVDMNLDMRALMVFLEHRAKQTKQLTCSEYLYKTYGTKGITLKQQNQVFDFVRDVMSDNGFVQDLDLRVYNAIAGYVIRCEGDEKKWKAMTKRNLVKK